jgi:hypothetical protein
VDARVLDASGREKKLHATSVKSLLQARTFYRLTDLSTPYRLADHRKLFGSGHNQPHVLRGHSRTLAQATNPPPWQHWSGYAMSDDLPAALPSEH